MAKHLSKRQVEAIVDILNGWPAGTRLTWSTLIKRVSRRLSIEPSRQTLARQERVKFSFDIRKAELRKGELDGGDSRVLGQRVQRLTTENRALCDELRGLQRGLSSNRTGSWRFGGAIPCY